MAIPIATLENSVQTLWSFQRALTDAVASKNRRDLHEAIEDLGILANHSQHQVVRDGAAKTLRDLRTTTPAAASMITAPDVVAMLSEVVAG